MVSAGSGNRRDERMRLSLARAASVVGIVGLAASGIATTAATGATGGTRPGTHSRTPIKHVIVIIAENHSFDNIFATYTPPGRQHIQNLLTEGIVTKSGAPGPSFKKAAQLTASDTVEYTLTPTITG